MSPVVEPITHAHLDAVLTLNNAHTTETSALTRSELRGLIEAAFCALTIDTGDAFAIALDQEAAYKSTNYLWFEARYPTFVYVDRVITAPYARGRGLARALYEAIISRAVAQGHTILTCEVNTDPPNPASDAFHAGFGFREVGRAALPERRKQVRYLVKDL